MATTFENTARTIIAILKILSFLVAMLCRSLKHQRKKKLDVNFVLNKNNNNSKFIHINEVATVKLITKAGVRSQ